MSTLPLVFGAFQLIDIGIPALHALLPTAMVQGEAVIDGTDCACTEKILIESARTSETKKSSTILKGTDDDNVFIRQVYCIKIGACVEYPQPITYRLNPTVL